MEEISNKFWSEINFTGNFPRFVVPYNKQFALCYLKWETIVKTLLKRYPNTCISMTQLAIKLTSITASLLISPCTGKIN